MAFLKPGPTSFGTPVAHLGYFREELVVRRRWLDDRAYADRQRGAAALYWGEPADAFPNRLAISILAR